MNENEYNREMKINKKLLQIFDYSIEQYRPMSPTETSREDNSESMDLNTLIELSKERRALLRLITSKYYSFDL
jgi:hypothetical protein